MTFTVLGASGFIGSRIVRALGERSLAYRAPTREDDLRGMPLGHVVYCIGLTADFRRRPYDTVRAHVCHLLSILEHADFESFLYLSTTRLYGKVGSASEDVSLMVDPQDPGDLYNISKLMGESVCLATDRPNVRIARLSNVYGDDFSSENFLSSVIRDAVTMGRVTLHTSHPSAKDYIGIRDVVQLLPRIAREGRQRIYNVASGMNTSNAEILAVVRQQTGCEVEWAESAETISFPPINIDRIRDEFDYTPSSIVDSLGDLIGAYQRARRS
jgi:nucleoside-diphosphate-sugar epimerase